MTSKISKLSMTVTYKAVSAEALKITYRNPAFNMGPARVPAMQPNQPTQNKELSIMKHLTKLKLSFASLAFVLPLAIAGCDRNPPQTGDTMTNPTMATNQPQMDSMMTNAMNNMAHPQMGHMESNSMNMAGSSMNNMTSNNMNMANSPQAGNMTSGSMVTTNQPQMNNMGTNSMNNMTPQTGTMKSHP